MYIHAGESWFSLASDLNVGSFSERGASSFFRGLLAVYRRISLN
jgi:hypothetical protein